MFGFYIAKQDKNTEEDIYFLVLHKTFNAIVNLRLPKTSSGLLGLNYANVMLKMQAQTSKVLRFRCESKPIKTRPTKVR